MLESDNECLDLLATLPSYVQYVVVLTKADKRGGGLKTEMVDSIYKKLAQRVMSHNQMSRSSNSNNNNNTNNNNNNILDTAQQQQQQPSDSNDTTSNIDTTTITPPPPPTTTTTNNNNTSNNNTIENSLEYVKRKIPILLTSSETKQGGVELWSVMLDAIANDDAATLFYDNNN